MRSSLSGTALKSAASALEASQPILSYEGVGWGQGGVALRDAVNLWSDVVNVFHVSWWTWVAFVKAKATRVDIATTENAEPDYPSVKDFMPQGFHEELKVHP
jgi:hypothetical protein